MDVFKRDMMDSLAVENFMDSTVYLLDGVFSNERREHYSIERQKAGVDLTVDINGIGNVIIDEKARTAALRNLNYGFTDCLMELTNNASTAKCWPDDTNPDIAKLGLGWFVNPKSVTEYYFFIFPKIKTSHSQLAPSSPMMPQYIDTDNFCCYLTSKKNVSGYIKSTGMTASRISEIIKKFCNPSDTDITRRQHYHEYWDKKSGLRFYRSISCKKEQSISISIPSSKMDKLSIVYVEFSCGTMNAITPTKMLSQDLPKYFKGQYVQCDGVTRLVDRVKYVPESREYVYMLHGSNELIKI